MTYPIRKIYETYATASKYVTAENNTDGVELVFDKGSRKLVEWYVELGGAGTIKIQVSRDKVEWLDTVRQKTLSDAGYWNDWDFIGFNYVKVVVPTTGIKVKIVISAI